LIEIKGFNGWVKGEDPSYIQQMMLTSINAPIRVGRATVLPGDVVLAKKYGVIFIPAYLLKIWYSLPNLQNFVTSSDISGCVRRNILQVR